MHDYFKAAWGAEFRTLGPVASIRLKKKNQGQRQGPSLFLVAWIPSPRGGGVPAFLDILGALSRNTSPPPPGGVGWVVPKYQWVSNENNHEKA